MFKPVQRPAAAGHRRVSIPRSGFWVFKRVVRAASACCMNQFQSLGRDSGCSSQTVPGLFQSVFRRFNPSVGILGVQACPLRRLGLSERPVSIPRSGFWVFKLAGAGGGLLATKVSIPRSGFWVFKPPLCGSPAGEPQVSIPRSGFWVFKQRSRGKARAGQRCFNPSVGILGVQADQAVPVDAADDVFQSLGRDSGCSSLDKLVDDIGHTLSFNPSVGILGVQACIDGFLAVEPVVVSIPRSGFWVFKQR